MEPLQKKHSLCKSVTTFPCIFNDIKGCQVIHSIARLSYMLEELGIYSQQRHRLSSLQYPGWSLCPPTLPSNGYFCHALDYCACWGWPTPTDPVMPLLLHSNCTTKTKKECDIKQMFVCHSDLRTKQENNIQPEINNGSYQEEKINDSFPGAVMIPGSSLSKELNTAPNYSISGVQCVHKTIHK